jgi:hypothetical protein
MSSMRVVSPILAFRSLESNVKVQPLNSSIFAYITQLEDPFSYDEILHSSTNTRPLLILLYSGQPPPGVIVRKVSTSLQFRTLTQSETEPVVAIDVKGGRMLDENVISVTGQVATVEKPSRNKRWIRKYKIRQLSEVKVSYDYDLLWTRPISGDWKELKVSGARGTTGVVLSLAYIYNDMLVGNIWPEDQAFIRMEEIIKGKSTRKVTINTPITVGVSFGRMTDAQKRLYRVFKRGPRYDGEGISFITRIADIKDIPAGRSVGYIPYRKLESASVESRLMKKGAARIRMVHGGQVCELETRNSSVDAIPPPQGIVSTNLKMTLSTDEVIPLGTVQVTSELDLTQPFILQYGSNEAATSLDALGAWLVGLWSSPTIRLPYKEYKIKLEFSLGVPISVCSPEWLRRLGADSEKILVVVGPPSSGKTFLRQKLDELGVNTIDIDDYYEEQSYNPYTKDMTEMDLAVKEQELSEGWSSFASSAQDQTVIFCHNEDNMLRIKRSRTTIRLQPRMIPNLPGLLRDKQLGRENISNVHAYRMHKWLHSVTGPMVTATEVAYWFTTPFWSKAMLAEDSHD